jgi:hypothetical protein
MHKLQSGLGLEACGERAALATDTSAPGRGELRYFPARCAAGFSGTGWGGGRRKKKMLGRAERAPSADLLGCVSACVAAGLNLASEGGGKTLNSFAFALCVPTT